MQTRLNFRALPCALLVAITAIPLVPLPVGAQTNRFWQGGTNGAWDNSANWTLGAPGFPNAAGDGALNIQQTPATTTQATLGGVTVGTIGHDSANFNTSWTITTTTPITLNNLGVGALIRNTNISTGASNFLSITSTGGLVLAENLNIANTSGSTASAGSIRISTPISGTGDITLSNVSNDVASGQIVISGINTFSGTVLVQRGATTFNNASAFGNVAGNTITIGQAGQGSASLVGTTGGVLPNNIIVASGTTGTSLLGSTANTATAHGYSGTIALSGDLSITSADTGTNTTNFSGVISGTGGLTKTGTGNATLSGSSNNTYTGKTVVNSGTLILNKTAGVNAISSTGATGADAANTDLQITGGSVQLNASNQIINSATIGLSGGTLHLNGVSEGSTAAAGVGALTLSSSSIIDLAGTNPALHFAASSGQTWAGTLSIYNWNGTPVVGSGLEQILFGSDNTALTQTQLDSISFYSDSGTTFLGTATFTPLNNGELVPVPEPRTWIGGALALLAVGWTQRKRFGKRLRVVG